MAEPQRQAFSADLDQLVRAYVANDDALARETALGIARLLFFEVDRLADALERIADAADRERSKPLSKMRFG